MYRDSVSIHKGYTVFADTAKASTEAKKMLSDRNIVLPKGVTISRCAFRTGRKIVDITVRGESNADIQAFRNEVLASNH